jgi:hypothetical protein
MNDLMLHMLLFVLQIVAESYMRMVQISLQYAEFAVRKIQIAQHYVKFDGL